MKSRSVTRREFVKKASAAGAISTLMPATVLPRHVLGGPGYIAPSDKLNIAAVGAGGMGSWNMQALTSENIVAICDVNFDHVHNGLYNNGKVRDGREALAEAYGKAARYDDYRIMLDKQKDIDAVMIATPDHTHAVVAAMAMRMGKHVYVQKPLTWSVHEARVLEKLAEESGVVTQMGNQGHSTDESRRVNELIQGGAIGDVREVHAWTNRPVWPQGIPRPKRVKKIQDVGWGQDETLTRIGHGFTKRKKHKIPKNLNWDLFLGPAPYVEYHPIYQPFTWRGWIDYGTGALGDMGAHLIDHPFWALDLRAPETVEATSTPWGADKASPWGDGPTDIAAFPSAMSAHYKFAARHGMPEVKLHWYEGGLMPARPEMLPDDVALPRGGGVIYVGSKGVMMHEGHARKFKMYPDHLNEDNKGIPEKYERVTTSHEMNWANACKGIGKAVSPFSYASPLTQTMLLGIAALRTGQGVKLYWDANEGKFTNNDAANEFLHREYRAGYTL